GVSRVRSPNVRPWLNPWCILASEIPFSRMSLHHLLHWEPASSPLLGKLESASLGGTTSDFSTTMDRADVIIVGAGAAGLAAASDLASAGHRVLILEARERIGGRIWTLRDDAFGIPVEMGAEFIHGRPAATFDLIHEAKLTACDLPF